MKKTTEKKLVDFFRDKSPFSRAQLFKYFLKDDEELKEGTFGWRIYNLKQKNILQETKRGWYTISGKPVYTPGIDDHLIKLADIFTSRYRDTRYCLWNLNWLNEFTIHQFNRSNILLETEKDLAESVAHTLADHGYSAVLKGGYEQLISFTGSITPVILRPLISRAPVQHIGTKPEKKISVPTIEKILIDIYSDVNTFHFIQGAELERIFEHALTRYAINFTKLAAYAKRRGKNADIHKYLKKYFPHLIKNLF